MATYTVATVSARLTAQVREWRNQFKSAGDDVEGVRRRVAGLNQELAKPASRNQAEALKSLGRAARETSQALASHAIAMDRSATGQAAHTAKLAQLARGYVELTKAMHQASMDGASSPEKMKQLATRASALNRDLQLVKRSMMSQDGTMRASADEARRMAQTTAELSDELSSRLPDAMDDTRQAADSMRGATNEAGLSLQSMLNFAGGLAIASLISDLTGRMRQLVTESVESAARTQEMNIVLERMGQNAGVSTAAINEQIAAIVKLGIESGVAQDAVSQFLRNGLDINTAAPLARAVQDIAVISGLNSSETLDRVLYGVISRQTEVLRTAGVNINQEQAFADYARSLNKAASEMTEAQKQQAILNAIIKDAANVEGVYEAAMTSGNKARRSLVRYASEIKTAFGATLLPIFDNAVFALTALAKVSLATFGNASLLTSLRGWAEELARPFQVMTERLNEFKDTGLDLSGVTSVLRRVVTTVQEMGKAGQALAAIGIAKYLSAFAGFGRFLGPLTSLPGIIIAVVASSEDLRASFGRLITNVVGVLATFAQELAPAFAAVSDAARRMGPPLAAIVDQLTPLVPLIGVLGVGAIRGFVAVLRPMLDGLVRFVEVLERSRVAMVVVTAALAAFVATRAQIMVLLLAKALGEAYRNAQRLTAAIVANPLLVVFAALAAGAAFLYSKLQEVKNAQEELNDRTVEYYQGYARAFGSTAAVDHINERLSVQKAKLDEASAAHDAYLKKTGTREFGVPGLKVSNAGAVVSSAPEFAANAQVEALQKARERIFTDIRESMADWVAESEAAMQRERSAVEGSMAVINQILDANSMVWIDYSKLTVAQAALIEQRITEFVASTEKWSQDLTSMASALKAKEEMGFQDLMSYYETQRARIEYFWSDLSRLMELGLSTRAVQDLVEAGPLAMGDAVGRLVEEAGAKGDEYAREMISGINRNVEAAQTAVQTGTRAIAEQMLMDQGAFVASTVDEMKRVTDSMTTMKENIVSDSATVEAGLLVVRNSARGAAGALADDYAHAAGNVLKLAGDATATAGDVQKALAEAATISAKLISTDPAQQAMVDQINAMMAVIAGNHSTLVSAGEAMGIDIGSGLRSAAVSEAARAMMEIGAAMSGMQGVFSAAAGGAIRGAGEALLKQAQQKVSTEREAARRQTAVDASRARRPQTEVEIGRANEAAKAAAEDAQKAASQADENAKRYQEALAKMDWVGKWSEAWEKVIGVMHDAAAAQDRSQDSIEGLARSLVKISSSSDDANAKLRQSREAVRGLIDQVRAETEAMAKSGQIANDAATMTGYFNDRLAQLQDQLPALIGGLEAGAGSFETLKASIAGTTEAWERYLGIFMDASEATYGREESYDKLNQAVMDQRALLTGVYLSEKDRNDIKRGTARSVMDYVRAVQNEIKAGQQAGEIAGDQATANRILKERLIEVGEQFPELREQIRNYVDRIDAIPDTAPTTAQVLVEDAKRQIEDLKRRIAEVTGVTHMLIQVELDASQMEASVGRVRDSLAGVGGQVASVQQGLYDTGEYSAAYTTPTVTHNMSMANHAIAMVNQNLVNLMVNSATAAGTVVATAIGVAAVNAIRGYSPPTPPSQNRPGIGGGGAKYFDTGGVLEHGSQRAVTAINNTGRPELIFTADQLHAIAQLGLSVGGGGKGTTTIGEVNIYEQQQARGFYDEALWKAVQ